MSWISHHPIGSPPYPSDPTPSKWICDHCAEVYKAAEQMPRFIVREERGKPYKVIAARQPRMTGHRYPTWLKDVHYCKDECAAEHIGLVVEEALKKPEPKR